MLNLILWSVSTTEEAIACHGKITLLKADMGKCRTDYMGRRVWPHPAGRGRGARVGWGQPDHGRGRGGVRSNPRGCL